MAYSAGVYDSMFDFDLFRIESDVEFADRQRAEVEKALSPYPKERAIFIFLAQKDETLSLLFNAVRVRWAHELRKQLRRAAEIYGRMAQRFHKEADRLKMPVETPAVLGMISDFKQGMPWLIMPSTLRVQAARFAELAKELSSKSSDKSDADTFLMARIIRHVRAAAGSPRYPDVAEILCKLGMTIDAQSLSKRVERFERAPRPEMYTLVNASIGMNRQIENPAETGGYVATIKPKQLAIMQRYENLVDEETDREVGLSIEEQLEEALDLYIDIYLEARFSRYGVNLPSKAKQPTLKSQSSI